MLNTGDLVLYSDRFQRHIREDVPNFDVIPPDNKIVGKIKEGDVCLILEICGDYVKVLTQFNLYGYVRYKSFKVINEARRHF